MQEKTPKNPDVPSTSTDAGKILVERFTSMSQRLSQMSASMSHLRDRLSAMAEMAGRVNAAFVAMVGLPRMMRSDLFHAVAGSNRGLTRPQGGGSGGGGAEGLSGSGNFDYDAFLAKKRKDRDEEVAHLLLRGEVLKRQDAERRRARSLERQEETERWTQIKRQAAEDRAARKADRENERRAEFNYIQAKQRLRDSLYQESLEARAARVQDVIQKATGSGPAGPQDSLTAAYQKDLAPTLHSVATKARDPNQPLGKSDVKEALKSLGAFGTLENVAGLKDKGLSDPFDEVASTLAALKSRRGEDQVAAFEKAVAAFEAKLSGGTVSAAHETNGALHQVATTAHQAAAGLRQVAAASGRSIPPEHATLASGSAMPGSSSYFVTEPKDSGDPNAAARYGVLPRARPGDSKSPTLPGGRTIPRRSSAPNPFGSDVLDSVLRRTWRNVETVWTRAGKAVGDQWGRFARSQSGGQLINVARSGVRAARDKWQEAKSTLSSTVTRTGVGILGTAAGIASAGAPDAFATLTGSMKLLAGQIAGAMIPTMVNWAGKLQEWADWLAGMSDKQKEQLAGWVEWGLGLTAGVTVFSKLVSVLGLANASIVSFAAAYVIAAKKLADHVDVRDKERQDKSNTILQQKAKADPFGVLDHAVTRELKQEITDLVGQKKYREAAEKAQGASKVAQGQFKRTADESENRRGFLEHVGSVFGGRSKADRLKEESDIHLDRARQLGNLSGHLSNLAAAQEGKDPKGSILGGGLFAALATPRRATGLGGKETADMEAEKKKQAGKGSAMAFAITTKATAQYSGIEEAYKNLTIDIMDKDPMKIKELKTALEKQTEMFKEIAKREGGLVEALNANTKAVAGDTGADAGARAAGLALVP